MAGRRQGGAARCLGPGDWGSSAARFPSPQGGARQRGDTLTVVRTRRRASSAGHWARSLGAGNTGSGRTDSRTPPGPGSPVWRNRLLHAARVQHPGDPGRSGLPAPHCCSHGLPPCPPLSRRPAHPGPPRPPGPAPPRASPRPGSALAHPRVPEDPSCPGCWAKVSLSSPPQPRVETDPGPARGNCLCAAGSPAQACLSHLGTCHLLNKPVSPGADTEGATRHPGKSRGSERHK